MGLVITPESELGKELAKHEQHHTNLIPPGGRPGNPYVYRPFPKMVYRAVKKGNGKVVCMEPLPQPVGFKDQGDYLMAYAQAEAIQRASYQIVPDESAYLMAKGQGWCESPTDAIEQFEREEQARGNAAAEAAYHAQRMSDKARAEFDAAQDDTIEHVSDVKPMKRGPRKSVAVNAEDAE